MRAEEEDKLGASSLQCGKTRYAVRHIPLTERAATVLARRISNATSEWLFPYPYDSSKPVTEVRKAHDAAVERSGSKSRFRLYDLRHTALSRMAMAGIDLPTLKELAGHSQIQMTMRYVHPTPEHKRRAIERFEIFRQESYGSPPSQVASSRRHFAVRHNNFARGIRCE